VDLDRAFSLAADPVCGDPAPAVEGLYLTLATGWRDSQRRRHPTFAWDVWREEAPWMTLYFSFGVWTSLAMVLLEGAAWRI